MTEPLKEEILKGDVHTIDEMKAWLQAFGYSDAIKDATISYGFGHKGKNAAALSSMRVISMEKGSYLDYFK